MINPFLINNIELCTPPCANISENVSKPDTPGFSCGSASAQLLAERRDVRLQLAPLDTHVQIKDAQL